jgi:hypothetical protein
MALPTRGVKLARRYPVLKEVPDDERPTIVRKALRHPKLIIPLVLVALLALPPYFGVMFETFGVHNAEVNMFWMAKVAAIMLVPICLFVAVLSRFVVPWFIKKEMAKRGYGTKD